MENCDVEGSTVLELLQQHGTVSPFEITSASQSLSLGINKH